MMKKKYMLNVTVASHQETLHIYQQSSVARNVSGIYMYLTCFAYMPNESLTRTSEIGTSNTIA